MLQSTDISFKTTINFCLVLTIIFSAGFGCGGMNNPFRDYSSKPFNSKDWRSGDAIERGRMFRDLYKSRAVSGKSRESVLELLGEPDKKSQVEGREVWSYLVKLSGQSPTNYFTVSFNENKSADPVTDIGGTNPANIRQ